MVMTSLNILLFPGRTFDIVWYHHVYGNWPSNREFTRGDPPALPDFERPGLFRVKAFLEKTAHFYCNAGPVVMSLRSQMIRNFVSSSVSLILRKEHCEYLSEMKRNNFY